MNEIIPDDGGKGVRRYGTVMIAVGWFLAIVVLTALFGGLLGGGNPNTSSVLNSQEGPLVLLRDSSGMYRAEGLLNGLPTEFLLDTGATSVAVPYDVAEEAGMRFGSRTYVETANGTTTAWVSIIDRIQIGSLEWRNVEAVVVDNLSGQVLLGMTALGGVDFTHSGGELELRPSSS